MARTRRRPSATPQRLILDSGAVIALSRRDPRARAFLTAAWEAGVDVSVPSVVVAETVRGTAADAPVNRILKAVGDVPVADESTARVAGALLRSAASSSTIDAFVVATAVQAGGGVVLTGDADDLRALAQATPEVVVEAF